MKNKEYKSLLHEMVCTTKTDLWNDSCSVDELSYAIENGAVGATANPVIVMDVLKKEMRLWKDRIRQIIEEMRSEIEDDIAWKLVEEISAKGAALLRPIFEREKGKKGRLSIQTDPKYYHNSSLIVKQAERFNAIAPNMIIKIPVTKAGVKAIEEATYRGISINATVCFTVPQALAVADAVEKGLNRRKNDGKDIYQMGPVCTIMVGRLDDWLKLVANRDGIVTDPGYLEWAGIAVMKKAYQIYRERGFSLRLLTAAYRNHMQWSEFIGGDIIVSIPYKWQKIFNASDIEIKSRIENPVNPNIIDELMKKFADFRRAYEVGGMALTEFDEFGPTRRTLRQFMNGLDDLIHIIRDLMLPSPD